jgi:hypothetical protein
MKHIYRYYKNSNTGELIKTHKVTDTPIKGIPVYMYDFNGNPIGENEPIPSGFIEISEKKYNRIKRKSK